MTEKDQGGRPETSSITRTVTGSKEDIIGSLQERVESEMATYRSTGDFPRYVREHARGIAVGVEYAQALIRDWQVSTREWLYGLTADEWFHLASEGPDSEVAPCCGNTGEVRDLLRQLMMFQAVDEWGFRLSLGDALEAAIEADGGEHGLGERDSQPLLRRVLAGFRAEKKNRQAQFETAFPAPLITGTRDEG